MSEEILKALTQLFAIISKQDDGVSEIERNFVINFYQQELDRQSVAEYIALYDNYSKYGLDADPAKNAGESKEEAERKANKRRATTVNDSVKVLAACRKINKTLNQKQKVIVLVKILEMIASDRAFTTNRMEIISTISDVFNIAKPEYKLIEGFVISESSQELDYEDILVFDEEVPASESKRKWIDSGLLDGEIIFIRVKSVGLYFTKYTGEDTITLNGQVVKKGSILQFAPGSIFKTPKGAPLYYSDLVTRFTADSQQHRISFQVKELEFRFPNGAIGLRDINLSEGPGSLIGIMGASGAGKTTLLNVLAGLEKPYKGAVTINGIDIHKESHKIEGVIGYIAQDDLLMEELTVYQNLYYNAKLCFKDLSEKELNEKVMSVLTSLGLDRIANLKVGNVLNKKISGGQRKRLNIALELIREPAVMFVDEPTSGLSSRDSENVIDLLKELSLKGKLIFVVIHQPSSDIYKMFDKMFILDTGGYPAFYGNPIEAVIYFKRASQQVDSERGQCPTCGNVTPEQLFNIMEARVVDEYGEFTAKRKVTPGQWQELYNKNIRIERIEDVKDAPPSTLRIPGKLMQTAIFTVRDFLSKISNTQYLMINLLEAPLLAVLLSSIIRYKPDGVDSYIYGENDNIPAYILICIIIALFMGLTVSAEEIIRDRKIQKRESFLNLSRISYLFSKLIILFSLSAIQTLSFVLIGNTVLDVEGMNLMYWFVLFSVSCHANVLGLNISSAFNSAVTVYIIIPLLLIPQMILSGLIFDYDKLNNVIRERGKTPLIADFMASRWSYEAMAVAQFKDNDYYKYLFEIDAKASANDYRANPWHDKLEELVNDCALYSASPSDSTKRLLNQNLRILTHELGQDYYTNKVQEDMDVKGWLKTPVNQQWADSLKGHLTRMKEFYEYQLPGLSESKDSVLYVIGKGSNELSVDLRNEYHNKELESLLRNNADPTADKLAIVGDRIVQLVDPVFMAIVPDGPLDYRTHFFAGEKWLFGKKFSTLAFNMGAIWLMTFLLFLTLYFELLAKGINALGKLGDKLPFKKD